MVIVKDDPLCPCEYPRSSIPDPSGLATPVVGHHTFSQCDKRLSSLLQLRPSLNSIVHLFARHNSVALTACLLPEVGHLLEVQIGKHRLDMMEMSVNANAI